MSKRKAAAVLKLAERRPPIEKPLLPMALVEDWLAEMKREGKEVESLAIHYIVRQPNGSLRPCVWFANMPMAERIAFAAVQLTQAVDEWGS